MNIRLPILALLLALVIGTTFAHGTKVHVFGTVEKMDANSVLVKTKDGKSVEVRLATSTVYFVRSDKVDKPAKLSDLAVGDLVVIHATSKDNTLEADEVKFTVPSTSKAGAPAATKPN